MAKTDLKIVATSGDDRTINTTISDINPDLQPADARVLAQKLNALTSNTYVKTDRIETINIDNAEDKTALTLSEVKVKLGTNGTNQPISNIDEPITLSIAGTDFATSKRLTFTYNAGATSLSRAIATRTTTSGSVTNNGTQYWQSASTWVDTMNCASGEPQTISYHLKFAEDATHLAFDKTITFNIVQGGE